MIAGACFVAVAATASCRDATQVVVEARTNLAYRAGLVVSFTVGGPGETERNAPTTETRDPWGSDGFVGSLAVVPGSENDAALVVKVVMGVDREARRCEPPAYDGCIVARRRLRYTPHERLRLPITLYAKCLGVPCTAESTCNVLGQCVDAQVDPLTCDGDEGCVVSGDPQPAGPVAVDDAGDGSASDGDGSDAGSSKSDAAADGPLDARADSAPDASEGGIAGGVDCGGGVFCEQGQVCCYDGATFRGACVANGGACPYYRIECDGREQCPAGRLCCVTPAGTTCGPMQCAGQSAEICHSTKAPPLCYINGKTCGGAVYGRYRVCQ